MNETLNIVIIGFLSITMLITFIRFLLGPTASDRIMALDIMGILTIVSLVFVAFFFQRIIYLDVALVYGVIGFVGTITLARFIGGGL